MKKMCTKSHRYNSVSSLNLSLKSLTSEPLKRNFLLKFKKKESLRIVTTENNNDKK